MIRWIDSRALKEIESVPIGDTNIGFPYTPQMDVKALIWIGRQASGNILEVGCNEGYTTYHLAKALPDRTVFGVDSSFLPGIHPEQRREIPKLAGRRARHLPNVRILMEDFSTLSVDRIRNVGFAFIDGDHTYEGVKRDTEKVFQLLKRGQSRFVAWHDFASVEEEPRHPAWLRVGQYIRSELSERLEIYRVHRTTVVYTQLV